ncbi:MAG TPA: S41 family peptidase [Prolixibacteraceae bacterium]|nr:S41 family peptidase [Prolixibacteraceae bacterium]
MKEMSKLFFLLLLLTAVMVGCQDEPLPEPEPGKEEEPVKEEAPELTQRVNQFMEDVMTDVYLWYNTVPDIDIRYEFDSNKYFDKLLNEEDKWSYVTEDIVALENSFKGVETSFGYSLAFGRFSNSENIFAVVEYVYPGTPAAQAGLKRGDFLIALNYEDISDETYLDLLNGETITVTKGVLRDGSLGMGDNVEMTSQELQLNPVLKTNIIEHEGHKIGYLMYAQFIPEFNASIDTALQRFKDEQITDLVLDLRYNPGGTTDAAQHLCSALAPLSVVNAESPLITYQWNDNYQDYWESQNEQSQLGVNFSNDIAVKMGLDNIHILTGQGTASASEFTITGLGPYMGVTTVGETTYGKYTASITMKPEFFYEEDNYYKDFKNWGIQPIVIRYANSQGITDFKDGFAPNIPVEDDITSGFPLGDKNEPLLKAAIEDITGTEIVAMKSAKKHNLPPFHKFDRGFSKYDVNKREMVIDNISKDKFLK